MMMTEELNHVHSSFLNSTPQKWILIKVVFSRPTKQSTQLETTENGKRGGIMQ